MIQKRDGKWNIFGVRRALLCLCVVLSLSACGSRGDARSEDGINVYYVNREETRIFSSPYMDELDISDVNDAVMELIDELKRVPEKLEYEAPIAGDVELLDVTLSDKLLTLNFAPSYFEVSSVREILLRAAIVRTLTQIDGVDFVTFLVNGEPLADAKGNIIGNMSADTFIYNAGNEINAYERMQLTLYFANEDGDGLIPVYRTVVYNSNIALERLVVDQLILGPQNDIANPTINPATGVLRVSVSDGICYVDLDSAFLTEPYAVQPQVALYSIVNSLAELPGINKVQILIGGETNVDFMESINLSNVLERNLDIVSR
ncbi:MAG: GerMN domain-containing protein [Lachnospiraceae bacterium]|nr:GerMN domain-containing protein [Lachnospiraceae bacterium]